MRRRLIDMKYVECKFDESGNLRIEREITEQEFNEVKNNRPQMVYPIDPINWQFVTGSINVR